MSGGEYSPLQFAFARYFVESDGAFRSQSFLFFRDTKMPLWHGCCEFEHCLDDTVTRSAEPIRPFRLFAFSGLRFHPG